MKYFTYCLLLLLAVMAVTSCTVKDSRQGKEMYLQTNIWHEQREIPSIHYHRGRILPAGTRVLLTGVYYEELFFKVVDPNVPQYGQSLIFTYTPTYSKLTFGEIIDRYFAETKNPLYDSFNEMEKKNIKEGTLEIGMSKEAVLAAYGYPPTHRTPDLNLDIWRYWISRFKSVMLEFSDNKLVEISY